MKRELDETAGARAGDDGVIGLVGLLMTLLILGALVAISLTVFDSASTGPSPTNPLPASGEPSASSNSSVGLSAVASCNEDAKIVETALAAYSAVNNGQYPPNLTALASSANGGPYLHTFPTSRYYAITTDGKGDVLVALAKGEEGSDGAYATTPDTNAESYDSFVFGSGPLHGANICAGARPN
jgi:hypothetical protein